MDMELRSVIVTGGASGIGRATALLLARNGARVFVGDVDFVRGQALAEEAAKDGLHIDTLGLELTDPNSIADFAAAVHARVERVDALVNGAGWDRSQPFMENSPEMWDRLIAINLMGAVRLARAVLPPMIAAGQGKIVNISSDAGRVGSMGETVYAAAKGGLIAFTKSLAREMARHRINVNCVCPGPTDTPLFHANPERLKDALIRAIPFRRLAAPEEIAETVMFFVGPRTDYITGQVLSVSGGLTMVRLIGERIDDLHGGTGFERSQPAGGLGCVVPGAHEDADHCSWHPCHATVRGIASACIAFRCAARGGLCRTCSKVQRIARRRGRPTPANGAR